MAKIFVVSDKYEATVKAFKVVEKYDADILVYVVSEKTDADPDEKCFYGSGRLVACNFKTPYPIFR